MKILNLYAGIGGNRKLWPEGHDITAVELDPKIAEIYKEHFPKDRVIVDDAHLFLLENYKNYDFIWASPPCPSHSRIRASSVHGNRNGDKQKAIYADMKLYQEIILLQNFAPRTIKYVIENVMPYYKPLIPGRSAGRHLYWANFYISDYKNKPNVLDDIGKMEDNTGFNIAKYDMPSKKKIKCLRNCVDPKLGLHIFNCAFRDVQLSLLG